VVNGGRFVSHQLQTAPHKLFGPSGQNIGLRPISNAAFEKTPDPMAGANLQNDAVCEPLSQAYFATNQPYYKASDERFVNPPAHG
jgi:hypothetical protein